MNPDILKALPIIICVSAAALALVGLLAWVALISYRAQQLFKNIEATRLASQAWPSTPGKVIKSRAEVRGGGSSTTVIPVVLYEYEVHGRVYRSDRLRVVDKFAPRKLGRDDAYQVVDRNPEGATVIVYYNPNHPEEAALER